MTQFQEVYDCFLSKILDDEWENWTEEQVKEDLFMLLKAAISRFKFPRKSLEYTAEGFTDNLSNDEIQILATYMKCEWLNRNILTWENVKPLYEERDFSQANLLGSFVATLEKEERAAQKLEADYYRSVNKKPFSFSRLAEQSP